MGTSVWNAPPAAASSSRRNRWRSQNLWKNSSAVTPRRPVPPPPLFEDAESAVFMNPQTLTRSAANASVAAFRTCARGGRTTRGRSTRERKLKPNRFDASGHRGRVRSRAGSPLSGRAP
eukprot:31356-Pelagococcus_subviridis.AAC.14